MAEELLYVLRVPESPSLHDQLTSHLGLTAPPRYVRLAVQAPLSNYGYDGYEGQLLSIQPNGLIIGHLTVMSVPRLFVPWHNVAYLGDGDAIAKAYKLETEAQAAG